MNEPMVKRMTDMERKLTDLSSVTGAGAIEPRNDAPEAVRALSCERPLPCRG